jgi:hypothetical protein
LVVARFSELALLLPNTDITMVIFGQAVFDLVRVAKKEKLGSLATRDIVWSYNAPKKSGGGSIEIKLHSHQASWTRETVLINQNKPDAMIGCNAGIFSYAGWEDPVVFSHMYVLPPRLSKQAPDVVAQL